MEGFADPFGKIERIRKDPYLNEQIDAMAVTLECFAMVQYRHPNNGEVATRPVRVIGIEMNSRTEVGGFWENLSSYQEAKKKNEDNRTNEPIPPPSFEIPKNLADAVHECRETARSKTD